MPVAGGKLALNRTARTGVLAGDRLEACPTLEPPARQGQGQDAPAEPWCMPNLLVIFEIKSLRAFLLAPALSVGERGNFSAASQQDNDPRRRMAPGLWAGGSFRRLTTRQRSQWPDGSRFMERGNGSPTFLATNARKGREIAALQNRLRPENRQQHRDGCGPRKETLC
jgi:hypothetical protein